MANIEKLLCMGLAHGADPRRMLMPMGDGNKAELDWTDIHRAVSALPPEQKAILYLRPNPDMVTGAELAALSNRLWRMLANHDRRSGTYATDESQSSVARRQTAIVRTVLAEYVDPRVCKRCTGAGSALVYEEGVGVVKRSCERCGGQGWRPWSEARRARAVGAGGKAWGRFTAGYQRVLDECGAQHRAGAAAFKLALFGEG